MEMHQMPAAVFDDGLLASLSRKIDAGDSSSTATN
jgi:hypothetical protein